MANYLSLPLELRHQILAEAIRAASDFDDEAFSRFRRHSIITRPASTEADIEFNKRLKAYSNDDLKLSQMEKLPGLTKTTIDALNTHPAVRDLLDNLMNAHASITPDLEWVMSTWVDGFTAEELNLRLFKMIWKGLWPESS